MIECFLSDLVDSVPVGDDDAGGPDRVLKSPRVRPVPR